MKKYDKPKGIAVDLFFVDGNSQGMFTAKTRNWVGRLLSFPREQLDAAIERLGEQDAGVYLLLAKSQYGKMQVYVGESESLARRLRRYNRKRDWWDKAVVVTTEGKRLGQTEVKYLEARLVQEAQPIQRISLVNTGNTPLHPLSESDEANMEEFLEKLFFMLPAVGVDVFADPADAPSEDLPPARSERASAKAPIGDSPTFIIGTVTDGVALTARAKIINGKFAVLAGSDAYKKWRSRSVSAYRACRDKYAELVDSGVLSPTKQDGTREFTVDCPFNKPSPASSVVLGRSTNGKTMWKVEGTDETYADWLGNNAS